MIYSLHWLPVRRRIEFKTATLCFKAIRLGNPPYLKNNVKAVWTIAISAFFHYGPANGSSHWHFIWSPSLFCGWTTNLEWITTWATTVQHTSVFQVSLEDILLPPLHGQLAPHAQVAPPIAFLWWSLRALKKFVTDTELYCSTSYSSLPMCSWIPKNCSCWKLITGFSYSHTDWLYIKHVAIG